MSAGNLISRIHEASINTMLTQNKTRQAEEAYGQGQPGQDQEDEDDDRGPGSDR